MTRRELDLGSDALGDVAGLIEQHFGVDVALSPLGTEVAGCHFLMPERGVRSVLT